MHSTLCFLSIVLFSVSSPTHPLYGPGDQTEDFSSIRRVLCLTDIQTAQLIVIYHKGVTTSSHWYSGVCFKLREILATWEAEIGKIFVIQALWGITKRKVTQQAILGIKQSLPQK
jgi:hypothetical protein